MRKLSGREIVLIYIFILLLIFYLGGIVLSVPVKTRYQETENRLNEYKVEQQVLEEKLSHADDISKSYADRKALIRHSIDSYRMISTGTSLEQHVLLCLDRAGLSPIQTVVAESEQTGGNGYKTGSIEVEAEGSYEAAVQILAYLEENPVLYVEQYVLCPEAGTDLELWNMTVRITCWLPSSWEETSRLIQGD